MKPLHIKLAVAALIVAGAAGGTILGVNHRNNVNHDAMMMQQADAMKKEQAAKAADVMKQDEAMKMKADEAAKMKADAAAAPASGDAMMHDTTSKAAN